MMPPQGDDLSRLDPRRRELLEEVLRKKGIDPSRLPIPRRTDPAGPAPLGPAQERLWVVEQLSPGTAVYNESYRSVLSGPLDVAVLARALAALGERHEILRTRFWSEGGAPVQGAVAAPPVSLPVVDLSGLGADERRRSAEAAARAAAVRPFDLASEVPFRALSIRLEPHLHHLVLTLHHIACDARSIAILARELSSLYGAALSGEPADLSELSIQYADYAEWWRGLRQPVVIERDLPHWRDRLAGAPTVLGLPTDRTRPSVRDPRGERVTVTFDAALGRRMGELGKRERASLFMTLLAGFGVLLGRYTGLDDLLVGTPVDTADRPELEGLVGFFVNTLPLRLDLSGDPTVKGLLERVRRAVLEDFEHKELPFARLVEELQPERSPGHPPLVQVLFILQRPARGSAPEERPAFGFERIDTATSKFDLTVVLRETDRGLDCGIEFSHALYDRTTMLRLAEELGRLYDRMAAAPNAVIGQISVLTPIERQQLVEWNDTANGHPAGRTFLDLFSALASERPDTPAVVGEGVVLTYGELDRRSRALALHLRRLGVGPEAPVGIATENRPEMVVGLLGILRAGGAYVPLDPAYPVNRLRYMVEDTGLRVVVTQERVREQLRALFSSSLSTVALDTDPDLVRDPDPERDRELERLPDLQPEDLAYVIYTSGSTGRPKGVMVHHRGLINLTLTFVDFFRLAPDERMLMLLSLSFDASVGDVFPALVSGATIVLHPEPGTLGGDELRAVCDRHRVTALELSAAFWQQWIAELSGRPEGRAPETLSTVVAGGDSITTDALRQWFALSSGAARVLHNYGPTEATVCSTSQRAERGAEQGLAPGRLPIGRPVPNARIAVLDARLRPVPPAVPGELCIGGRGVARGYLGRPATTAERFVPDPDAPVPGARMYRTGDLARWLPDGRLEFLGRRDHQLKIRGYRIEPGEVEAALAEHPAVAEASVVGQRDGRGGGRLLAYVVAAAGEELPGPGTFKSYLGGRLPEHMIPSLFVPMERLPLNENGKVDRKRLPEPEGARPDLESEFVAPAGRLEEAVAALWREVLAVERVGVHDNFFDLGGTSLTLIRLQSRLREGIGLEVSTVELFRYPTISALAGHFGERGAGATSRAREPGRGPDPVAPARPGGSGGIAIIGMAGRFPGAGSVAELWAALTAGAEGIRTLSDEEIEAEGIPAEVLADPGFVKARGVLEGYDRFDAAFFGISPREAELIDPQHRLFLECAWEALESAGHAPGGSPLSVGVFAGAGRHGYYLYNVHPNPELIRGVGYAQATFGNDKDFVPTRVSYKLDLRGPSVTVQSACSTSLVATHLACRSLRDGECEMALAGGVTVPVPHRAGYRYERGGIFSPDGHCRPFDQEARGTVPSSGVAVVVLKPLERALADGDTVHAVIRGSAVNNDGAAKVGYSAPGVDGQAEVIRAALRDAGVTPESIGYVEAHGTGTALGDAIEVGALAEVFGGHPPPGGRRFLGSLKSNLGHMDTAAGVAGLIKAALAVRHGAIPPTLHFVRPNPELSLDGAGLTVPAALTEWPAGDAPRRAGVSSFGIGGTNVHVVVEAPPEPGPTDPGRPAELLVLSARTEEALDRATDRLAAALAGPDAPALADAAHTLQIGRRELEHRRFVVCADRREAAEALGTRSPEAMRTGFVDPEAPTPRTVFLFPGSGAQYPRMGEGLDRSEPIYREALDRCAEILRGQLPDDPVFGPSPDLRTVLFPEEDLGEAAARALRRPALAMPSLLATEYALARLWASYGVRPEALIGHSLGECTAACLAGVMRLEDALAVTALRGRLFETLPPGGLLSVGLSEDELAPWLGGEVAIAAVNHPRLCTVSGPASAIDSLEQRLVAEGIDFRRVHIDAATHCPMVDRLLPPFVELLEGVDLRPPEIPVLSNVTGDWLTPEQATDPAYWGRQLRATVRFAEGLRRLGIGEGSADAGLFLEVGPGNGLGTIVRQQPGGRTVRVFSSMRHPRASRPDRPVFLEAVGDLWLSGAPIDWASGRGAERRLRVQLPTYPFDRRRYWIEPPADDGRRATAAPDGSPGLYLPYRRPTAPTRRPDRQLDGETGVTLVVDDGAFGGAPGESEDALRRAGSPGVVVSSAEEPGTWGARLGRRPDLVLWVAGEGAPSEGDRWVQTAAGLLTLARVLPEGEEIPGVLAVGPARRPLAAAALALARAGGIAWRLVELTGPEETILGDPGRAIRLLAAESLATRPGERIVYADGRRWAERFEVVARPSGAGPTASGEGALVVVGDLSAASRRIASALAELGDCTLLVAGGGESEPPDGPDPRAEELAASGVTVRSLAWHGAAADDSVESAIRVLAAKLRGVFLVAPDAQSLEAADPATLETARRRATALARAVDAVDPASGAARFLVSAGPTGRGGAEDAFAAAVGAVYEDLARALGRAGDGGSCAWTAVRWNGLAFEEQPAAALARLLDRDPAAIGGWGPAVVVSPTAPEDWPARRAEPDAPSSRQAAERAGEGHRRPELRRAYTAPRTETERTLAAIWQDMLGVEPIGVFDDYYELGGHSLLAIRMLGRIREETTVDLGVDALFESPTVAGLAERVDSAGGGEDLPVLGPRDSDGDAPLSPVHEGVFQAMDAPDGVPQHNASAAFRLRGALDLELLERALSDLARRHEILRTTFPRVDGRRVQRIAAPARFPVPVVDLQAVPEERREGEVERLVVEDFQRELDPVAGPLWSVMLLRLGPTEQVMVRTFHRLTTDGVSTGLWTEELVQWMEAHERGERPTLPRPALQYADFSAWHRRFVDAVAERHLEYWRERFDPPPVPLVLATDFPRPPVLRFHGARLPMRVPPDDARSLRDLGRAEGAGLFLTALAAYQVLLRLWSEEDQDDFGIATPVSYRQPATHRMMGRFINTLVLRADLGGDPTFRDLVRRTKEHGLRDFAHKDLPFERLVEGLQLPADPSRRPLAQVAFLLDEVPDTPLRFAGLEVEGVPVQRGSADFDLTLGFRLDDAGGLNGFLEYRNDLFRAATAERFARDFEGLVGTLVESPDEPLSILYRERCTA